MNTKRQFADLKVIQSAVEEVVQTHNIPKLVFPKSEPAAAAEVAPVPLPAATGAEVVTPAAPPKRRKQPAAIRRVSVDLPEYLIKDIAKRAVDEGCTKRFLYLQAFRAIGFNINDVDFQEDGRRDA